MTLTIPVWLLWLVGGALTLGALALMVAGVLFVLHMRAVRRTFDRWWGP